MNNTDNSKKLPISGKKRNIQHIIGDEGVRILKSLLPHGWVPRDYSNDYGIDLGVELFEECGEEFYITQGEHLFFQVKATTSLNKGKIKIYNRYNVEKTNDEDRNHYVIREVVKYSIDTNLISTVEKMGTAIPVLLAVVDVGNKKVYFVCLNDYIEKIIYPTEVDLSQKKKLTINIPIENCINDKYGRELLEWYGKRAKLYALFNKVHYQVSEQENLIGTEYYNQSIFFLSRLYKLDVWSACRYFSELNDVKLDMDCFFERGLIPQQEKVLQSMIDKGEDVDSPIWNNSLCLEDVSFRVCCKYTSLSIIWQRLDNLSRIFEEDNKEFYLPSFYFYTTPKYRRIH